ncbi:cag island domain protein [Helicobacter pylori Hp A-11]|uniref:Cag island domain protein n=1 Tax=Helicobacter pylori Hp A-11 TaxID=992035 RepID=N4T814_HELPX|nr:cag island domain protein [Helicobacter pylori Hp A-11]
MSFLTVRTNKALYQFILRIAQQDNFATAYLTVKLEYPQRQKVSSLIEEELKKREEEQKEREMVLKENRNITAYINRVMMASNEQVISKEKIREEKQKVVLDNAKALETQYVHKALNISNYGELKRVIKKLPLVRNK